MWEIPLWSRMGTGYVYSDKYISDDDAKQQFIDKLNSKGYKTDDLEFKNIDMRIGIHEKIWEKNVCAIGLSAGFIEPLESNGLYTVHKFLMNLVRSLNRGPASKFERESFNLACKSEFKQFAEFVAMHYALSTRNDTQYWKDNLERDYDPDLHKLVPAEVQGFKTYAYEKFNRFQFNPDGGFHCIAAGMGYNPCDISTITSYNFLHDLLDIKEYFKSQVDAVGVNIEKWDDIVKNYPSLQQYLKDNIYQN